MWITVQAEYEPINSLANKQPFEQYLNAAPALVFRRDKTTYKFGNLYIDFIRILTNRLRELNAIFIRE